jgi:NAD(P)-dependent dehydrogenase (short-subunit alcohol dehydrogenase family)
MVAKRVCILDGGSLAFLASEEAHWITGQMLTAEGGHTRH